MEKGYSPVLNVDMFPQKLMGFTYPGDIQPFINKAYEIKHNYPNTISKEFVNFMYSPGIDVLKIFKEFFPIKKYVEELVKLNFKTKLTLFSSWLNIYQKGGYNPFHTHHPMALSGVFYLKVPLTHPGLYFHNKFNPINHYNIIPQPGSIFLFDGDQPHSTLPNPTNEEKIVISFNLTHSD